MHTLAADLLSGVYHWAVDNYGDGSTPVFGSQIAGFQVTAAAMSCGMPRPLHCSLNIVQSARSAPFIPLVLHSCSLVSCCFVGGKMCVQRLQLTHRSLHATACACMRAVFAHIFMSFKLCLFFFQAHHQRPWTITERQFANNVHKVFLPALTFTAACLAASPLLPGWASIWLSSATFFTVMSQQFHAWSHMKRSELPSAVIVAQVRRGDL